jgi:hypothetical protein
MGYGLLGFCIMLLADYIQPGQKDFYIVGDHHQSYGCFLVISGAVCV